MLGFMYTQIARGHLHWPRETSEPLHFLFIQKKQAFSVLIPQASKKERNFFRITEKEKNIRNKENEMSVEKQDQGILQKRTFEKKERMKTSTKDYMKGSLR